MMGIKKRKVLLPYTMPAKYWKWFEEENIDFELIFSDSQAEAFSNAGEKLLNYIFSNGGSHYLVLYHMPSKRIDHVNGIDIARIIESNLRLEIPVIIFSSLAYKIFNSAFRFKDQNIPKNIYAIKDQISQKHEFISLIKKAVKIEPQLTTNLNRYKETN